MSHTQNDNRQSHDCRQRKLRQVTFNLYVNVVLFWAEDSQNGYKLKRGLKVPRNC